MKSGGESSPCDVILDGTNYTCAGLRGPFLSDAETRICRTGSKPCFSSSFVALHSSSMSRRSRGLGGQLPPTNGATYCDEEGGEQNKRGKRAFVAGRPSQSTWLSFFGGNSKLCHTHKGRLFERPTCCLSIEYAPLLIQPPTHKHTRRSTTPLLAFHIIPWDLRPSPKE